MLYFQFKNAKETNVINEYKQSHWCAGAKANLELFLNNYHKQ